MNLPAIDNRDKELAMALQEGEIYRCPDEDCACEITVTKGAAPGHGRDRHPTCCCGHVMEEAG
ncbi:hypothetical protein GCM10007170_39890 [Arthrobacter liuii]|uniref:Metallothionein n=1 Tax=Arthrobacter liuii TaxID=1476996 RepID=A0ABQ2AXU8_9MICC|nr:hypothetical protein GCM10007170_39890 [Arthrobacter liuii]